MTEWRRDMHRHPELGRHHVRTAKLVADEFRVKGLQSPTGIAPKGVTAILDGDKPGPRIATALATVRVQGNHYPAALAARAGR